MKLIIVGAGISGLSAGIYARQSGFDVTIYESHMIPGGASTSWRRKGYFFEGGSLKMASRMAKHFIALGGTIQYGKRVSKVSVQEGIANGVIIDGEYIKSDAVIVTQDTLAAIDSLFDEPIQEPWAQKMRISIKPVLNTFISLGVEADLSDVDENLTFMIDKPIMCGEMQINMIELNNYARYRGYAPEGCTALTSIILGDSYEFWKASKENGTYDSEKQKLAEAFIECIEKKYPQTTGKITVWDVATPLTYERYLHSHKGSWMSVLGKGSKMESYPSMPESIKNVYFAGQRLVPPGGLPVAAETGRKAVQYLCRETDTVFQGSI
jgi:phytoene dehydrogenase-like protein